MFTRAGYSPQFQLRQAFEIASPFRGRNPLYLPLQLACGPGDRGILTCRGPLLPPLYQWRSPQCAQHKAGCNRGRGSRSLPDLTGHLTARTGDGHAPPLSSSSKTFNLAFILLSLPVRFPALTPIKPQASPLVVLPRQFP